MRYLMVMLMVTGLLVCGCLRDPYVASDEFRERYDLEQFCKEYKTWGISIGPLWSEHGKVYWRNCGETEWKEKEEEK